MSRGSIKSDQRGYTLVEISVAAVIFSVVVLIGFQAYTYFNKETQQKITELNTIQQFNLLTKDLLGFSESAGLSTLYLNVPVRIKDCEDGKPCLRQLKTVAPQTCPEGQVCAPKDEWVPLGPEEIPAVVRGESCLQFYRDSHGRPVDKLAFADTAGATDVIASFRNFTFTSAGTEVYHTWPLKDETSTPLLLLKVRNIADFFALNAGMSFSRSSLRSNSGQNDEFRAAVFDSNMSPEQARSYVGYPMLFYGAQNQGHFGFYYIATVLSCREDRDACLQEIGTKIYEVPPGENLPISIAAKVTQTSFVLGLRPIDQTTPFFSEIYARDSLPSGCDYSWGGKQDATQYLLPSGLLSIFNPVNLPSDVNTDERKYYNPTSYNKYAAFEMADGNKTDPYAQLLPVDLIRYSVEKVDIGRGKFRLDLVAQLWHATETKKLTKVTNLSNTFWFTRKLGGSEFAIDYSPAAEPARPAPAPQGDQP